MKTSAQLFCKFLCGFFYGFFCTFALGFLPPQQVFAANDKSPPSAGDKPEIYIRTEVFARPPYSGATYYFYERGGQVICTKLEECNKYGQCRVNYAKGNFKDEQDQQNGPPFEKTGAVLIPQGSLRRHRCLTQFQLL